MQKALWNVVLAIVIATSMASAQAAGPANEEGSWQFKITPYAWAMGLKGDVGAGSLTAPVDVKFTDVVKKLELAGMLAAEAHNGTWGILLDGAYARLRDDSGTPLGTIDVKLEQWILNGAAVYRVVRTEKTAVDAGAGARFMGIHTDISSPAGNAGASKEWCDPIIVARVRQQIIGKVFGMLAGDIGGFGVSSRLTWQLTAAAGYSFTEWISALVGYRYLYYSYDSGGFKYDVDSSGLALGVQFAF